MHALQRHALVPSCRRYLTAQVPALGGEERPLWAPHQSKLHLQQLPPASLGEPQEGHLIQPHMWQLPPGSVREPQEGRHLPLPTPPAGLGRPLEGCPSQLRLERPLLVCRGQRQSQRRAVPGLPQACRQTLQSTR